MTGLGWILFEGERPEAILNAKEVKQLEMLVIQFIMRYLNPELHRLVQDKQCPRVLMKQLEDLCQPKGWVQLHSLMTQFHNLCYIENLDTGILF